MRIAGIAILIGVAVAGTVVAALGRRVHHVSVERGVALSAPFYHVASPVGDVLVTQGRGPGVTATSVADWTGSRAPSTIRVDRGTLRLSASCAGWSHVHFWLFGPRCEVRYRLSAPPKAHMVIAMGVGDLRLSALTGVLSSRTAVGDVVAAGLRTPTASVVVGTGDARLVFLVPPRSLDVTVGTGDATVTLPRGRYAIRAAAGLGDVRLGAGIVQDPTSARAIRVATSIGDVTVQADG